MARPLRPNIAGGVYHVMARGIERKRIYLDDEDRERFLRLLGKAARRYRWECLAYCLMDNHYHLVVRTPLPNLSRGMRLLNGGYASLVNARYERVGHLFQGRFRSVVIRSSDHLLLVIKYVLRNPVTAGLCASPADWRWSSYEAILTRDPRGVVDAAATLGWFGASERAPERFASFVGSDDPTATDDLLAHPVEFPCESESPPADRLSLEELLASESGAAGIARAYHEHGYSLAQIAAVLGRSRSAVGRTLIAHEAQDMLAAAWPRPN